MKKISLSLQILIALILAIIFGLLFRQNQDFVTNYIKPFGVIFLNLLKFTVVPVVLLSIICGIITMKDIKKVGKIGFKTVVYYTVTTFLAISTGLIGGVVFKEFFPTLQVSNLQYTPTSNSINVMDTIVGIFPSNFVLPMESNSMLQIIFMALLVGFSIILVGKESEPAQNVLDSFNKIFIKAMELILKLSPFGVFCLLTSVIAVNGASVISSLVIVLVAAYVCYATHMVVVYSLAVRILAKINPLVFFRKMFPAIAFSFSSASSVGTLPINMQCTQNIGASKEISSFVLPLGATINMDGTAIYQGICSVFIASCYGIDLTFTQMGTIAVTATLASVGTAGVPGAGMVMLAMVLTSVGLPVDGIALVAGVDRIFDMGRTTVNITGDASCAVIISHSERSNLEAV